MAHKSLNSMPSHSARRTNTRTRPSLSSPSSSAPPSSYSSSTQHVPSAQEYITSGPAFGINRTVNITVEVSSSSTPAYNGYDVRNYAPPVTTTCYSTEPSSSTSSYEYSMYEPISNFPDYSSNPPSPVDATTSSSPSPPSLPLQEHTPSTSSAASADYSYYASEGYASDHHGSQSEYLGNHSQGEEEAEPQVPHSHPPSQIMLRRFLTVDSEMDSLAYLARIAIRRGDVRDGEVPLLPSREW